MPCPASLPNHRPTASHFDGLAAYPADQTPTSGNSSPSQCGQELASSSPYRHVLNASPPSPCTNTTSAFRPAFSHPEIWCSMLSGLSLSEWNGTTKVFRSQTYDIFYLLLAQQHTRTHFRLWNTSRAHTRKRKDISYMSDQHPQTGPITPEGKARSSQNATTHGATSQQLILPGESQQDFDNLLANLTKEYQPSTDQSHGWSMTPPLPAGICGANSVSTIKLPTTSTSIKPTPPNGTRPPSTACTCLTATKPPPSAPSNAPSPMSNYSAN